MSKAIRIHPREMVIDDPQMPFTFDGTLCTLPQPNREVRVWETDLGTKPYYFVFQDPAENPLTRRVGTFSWDYSGYSDRWPNGLWVQSFYQVQPDESDHPAAQTGDLLVGFVHREFFSNAILPNGALNHGNGSTNSYHIGLALSLDRGMSWRYAGDVVSNAMNERKDMANMGGVPFFTIDGCFQFFFNEYPYGTPDPERLGYVHITKRYLSAARCKIRETVAALLDGRLPAVWKYSGDGVWDTDPLFETGAPLLSGEHISCDAHADAAYCSALGKYLLTAWHTNPAHLCLYLSADGVHFEDYITLYYEEHPEIMNPYSTFVAVSEDDSSADSSVVGREFYIFFPRKGTRDYGFDQWFRTKITIE